MKKYKQLKEAEYKRIKGLLNYDIPTKKVADIVSRSLSTVLYIRRFDTYEEYRKFVTDSNQRSAARRKEMYGSSRYETETADFDTPEQEDFSNEDKEVDDSEPADGPADPYPSRSERAIVALESIAKSLELLSNPSDKKGTDEPAERASRGFLRRG